MVHTQVVDLQVVDLLASIAAKTGVLDAYPSGMQIKMIDTSSGTLVVLIMLTGLAVYKPRCLTPYGQRKQDEQGKRITTEEIPTNQVQETAQERAGSPVRAAISQ
ncbi:hypothetical protein KSC_069680 [Ktedonobacter sp. SOSP1-52]|nr:hypothetical protein KSC_069680 [Ktedonobacter sp. SOSP1-52]